MNEAPNIMEAVGAGGAGAASTGLGLWLWLKSRFSAISDKIGSVQARVETVESDLERVQDDRIAIAVLREKVDGMAQDVKEIKAVVVKGK